MSESALGRSSLSVIIVGDGAIGSALLENLVKWPGLRRALVLGRNAGPAVEDKRISRLRFDANDPGSIAAAGAAARESLDRAHLLINTVGMLHSGDQQPEKRLASLDPEHLQQSFAVNATLLPLLAQAFGALLRHDEPALLASLSARVGSIEDNRMGGWYSYRASKAAHNMLLKTLALEWKISHRNTTVVALHPGTVASRLSEPFLTPKYDKRVLTPAECAQALLDVMSELHTENSGNFYDWQGKLIPW